MNGECAAGPEAEPAAHHVTSLQRDFRHQKRNPTAKRNSRGNG